MKRVIVPFVIILNLLFSCGTEKENNRGEILDENLSVEAEFPGGKQALYEYIAAEVRYPAYCKEEGIEGKVYVSFVINVNGEVEDIRIKRSVHKLLDGEVIRVIANMPTWQPGLIGGKPVKSRFVIPVNFALDNGDDDWQIKDDNTFEHNEKPRKPVENNGKVRTD